MIEWKKYRNGSKYCVVNCKMCNRKVKSCLYMDNLVCKKCFKKITKEVKKNKKCSKCKKEVYKPLYIERSYLFGLIRRIYCFSCYNKLSSRGGNIELREVKITHIPKYNIIPSEMAGRVPVPREGLASFSQLDDVQEGIKDHKTEVTRKL